ncbi:hypothetical protein PIB30_091277 [Stylosanthes scabra]|uniref:Uncharacterized protein n=1 Tax=Stylosanthes scabra TaxID=79078 RepID=A0ABU6UX57_9FABA|nr:hypothetical protein [Stylosanthes scabra]
MGDIASVLKDIREGQQNLLNVQRQQTSQVEPPKHCGICAFNSHYTDECPQLQEDHTIAATHNLYDQPSSNTNNQGWRNNQAPRQQPSQPQQPPMDDFCLFLQEQRVYQKQQATQMANLTEILAGLVTQNTNNRSTSSQPSSSSTLPSQPFPNPKGSINAISFHEDSLELEIADDDEEEFLKMLEEISMKDDVRFEESEGIIKLGDGCNIPTFSTS